MFDGEKFLNFFGKNGVFLACAHIRVRPQKRAELFILY